MDVIEKAIRSALEKGDADDRAYRERVYRSAFAALDRALAGNPGISQEVAEQRRSDLQAKVAEIETEFIPAVSAAPPEPARPAPPPAAPPPAEPEAQRGVPTVELDDRPRRAAADAPRAPDVPPLAAAPPSIATSQRAEPRFAGTPETTQPRFSETSAAEPTLAGSPPPHHSPSAERPLPESFFPDASDFESEARPSPKRISRPRKSRPPAART